jgi:hypothetical protein
MHRRELPARPPGPCAAAHATSRKNNVRRDRQGTACRARQDRGVMAATNKHSYRRLAALINQPSGVFLSP